MSVGLICISLLAIALILGWSYYCAKYADDKKISEDEKIQYNKQHLKPGTIWWTLIIENLPIGHAVENGMADKVCKIKEIKDNKVLVESFGPISSYEEEFDIDKFIRDWEFIK